jgi:hypothetical protein
LGERERHNRVAVVMLVGVAQRGVAAEAARRGSDVYW